MPTDFWGWVKFLGPYLVEVLKVILGGPNRQALENLKVKGVIKDGK